MLHKIYQKIVGSSLRLAVVCLCPLTVLCSSCDDFLTVDSRHSADETQQWETLEDTRAALMGVYGLMRAAVAANNTQWACGEVRMGDFTVLNNVELQAIHDNRLSTNYELVSGISDWSRFYRVINAASVFLEHSGSIIGKDASYSEENLKWDQAQARALRAFAYYYLVNIWGDVPLVTYSYDNGNFPQLPRTSSSDVLQYARKELLAAIENLPFLFGSDNNLYYNQESTFWRGLLINKLSAYAILAHVSALLGNYADVETYTSYILDNYSQIGISDGVGNGMMDIENIVSTTGLFNSTQSTYAANRLVNLDFDYEFYETSQDGHLEKWTLASPYVRKATPTLYVSTDSLWSIFTNTSDLRFGVDTLSMGYTTNYVNLSGKYPVFKKINVVQDGSTGDGNFALFGSAMVFSRLEEILLLNVEALIVLNRPEDAIAQLNELRNVRGLSKMSYNRDFKGDINSVLDEVFQERRRELMGEGWRFYDIIRRQRIRRDNPKLLKLIEDGGIYWPIAPEVIRRNPKIQQNQYWETNHE